jgi:hypothetical protein
MKRINVNFIDAITDLSLYFLDTSVGIGQVKISIAKMLEDNGYIENTIWFTVGGNRMTRKMGIACKLDIDKKNTRYVAAYLKYFQDKWKEQFPEIGERADILGTLYNIGHNLTTPRATPESTLFGDFVQKNYDHVKNILGLE